MADLEDVYRATEHLRAMIDERLPLPPDEPEQPKRRRLTKDDILATHLAAMTRTSSEHSSVRISRNARGDTQFEVVVRSGDSEDIVTAADAKDEAVRLYLLLDEAFKMRKAASDE